MEATHRTTLISSLQSLQQRYEDLTATCAGALNQIRVGNVSDGELDNNTAWDELTSWSNYSSDALNVADAQTTVEGLEEIQVTRDGNVMSEQLVDSYEERSHRLTMFGEPVGRGTPSTAWNTLLTDTGVGANPSTTAMERLTTQFSGRFMDALPGAGLASSAMATFGRQGTTTSQRNPGRVTTSTDSQGRESRSQVRHTHETRSGQLRNAGNFSLRGAGVLTAGYSAYDNFNSRQDERQMQLAQENPEMSAEEINTEATHDAAAFSAGATGFSVLAAAGAGAAAGSLVPGPGNAVGFVVGLGVGIATEIDFLPPIPGQEGNSSISDYAGHLAEGFWDGARSVGSDIADTVSESSLNPVNWF